MSISTLNVLFDGSTSVYGVIQQPSGTVWNGSGFESWNWSGISGYAISMSGVGGYLYTAQVPAALPYSSYVFSFYQQLGLSPASGDVIIDGYDASWNGTELVPVSGSVILDQYALCTLQDAKTEITFLNPNDTTYDDFLKNLINEQSYHFERLCDRKIVRRYYKQIVRARYGKIVFRQGPVDTVNKLAGNMTNAFWLTYAGSGIRCMYQHNTDDNILVKTWDTNGNQTTYTFPISTYMSTQSLCTALQSGVPGLNTALIYNIPTDYLYWTAPMTVKDESNAYNCPIMYACTDCAGYYIRENGFVVGGIREYNSDTFLVEYYAGYSSVPYEVKAAVISAVRIAFTLASQHLNFDSEDIGKYSYKLRDKDLPPQYYEVIKIYRRTYIAGK
jgi:hypothetical protein